MSHEIAPVVVGPRDGGLPVVNPRRLTTQW
jgi:hypothetical protein